MEKNQTQIYLWVLHNNGCISISSVISTKEEVESMVNAGLFSVQFVRSLSNNGTGIFLKDTNMVMSNIARIEAFIKKDELTDFNDRFIKTNNINFTYLEKNKK